MTEEVKQETVVETPEVVEHSEIELKAMEMGWRPKEEFSGNEEEFIDAKEFVRRQPLFDKIAVQHREVKQLRQAVEALKTHYTTVRETEYKRALEALKTERKAAVTDGDGDKFEALSQEIASVEEQVATMQQLKEQPLVQETPVHPEFQSWITANPWYQNNKYMREFADDEGKRLHAGGMAPADVLKAVAQAVRKEFPQKFQNPNKASAPNVANSSGKTSKSEGNFEATLTEQERHVMNTLVRGGHISKEKYLADLKAAKGTK